MIEKIIKDYTEKKVLSTAYIMWKYRINSINASQILKSIATNSCEKEFEGKDLIRIKSNV